MQTTKVTDDDGAAWTIHHNSDWSGPARITRDDTGEAVELPGRVLQAAARKTAIEMVIRALEKWEI